MLAVHGTSSTFARAVFAAGVFLILPASAFAQQVGVKGGINFASLTPEEDEEPGSRRPGLVAGVWVRTASSTRFTSGRGPVLREGRDVREHSVRRGQFGFDRRPRPLHRDSVPGACRLRRPGLDHARLRRWRRRACVQAVGSRQNLNLTRKNKRKISMTIPGRSTSDWSAESASSGAH